jgi:phosphonopyruvate decarboxylase
MGSLAANVAVLAGNFQHIVFNNGAHDSVGGQPTVGFTADLPAIALAAGYAEAHRVESLEGIAPAMAALQACHGPSFLEIRVRKGNRPDLGRPTTTPAENKSALMAWLGNG